MECKKLRLVAEESLPSLEAPEFAKRFQGGDKWKQWLAGAADRYRQTVPDSLGADGGDVDRLDPGVAPDEGEDLDGFVCEGVEMESDASSSDSSDPASEDDFVPHLEELFDSAKGSAPFWGRG